MEEDAGLHFLLKVDTPLSDEELTDRLKHLGLRVNTLSHYYHQIPAESQHCLVVNYAGLSEDALEDWLNQLPNTI